jgi:hypothetical protein
LKHGEEVIASAEKHGAARYNVELRLGDRIYHLRRAGLFSRTFRVYDGDDVIGSIAREKWYSRRAAIDLPADWPVPIRLFVFRVVQYLWQQMESTG